MSIAIVAIAKKEHAYIREWIESHATLGVSAFYIYDNGETSDQPLADILAGDSRCHVIPCPGENMQVPAYTHFITNVMPDAPEDWFAFIDCDEFICPVKHASIPEFLEEYGHLGSIGLQWRMFGCNGHVQPPETGGVIANYTTSTVHTHIKTLAHKSTLAAPIKGIHTISGTCRDLDGNPITSMNGTIYHGDMTDVIRINHYFTKSWTEFLQKIERGMADVPEKRDLAVHIEDLCGFDAVPDTVLAEKLGVAVHAPQTSPKDYANELEAIRSLLGDHPALTNIRTAFRANSHHRAFLAKAAGAYSMQEGSVDVDEAEFLTEFVRTHRLAKVLQIGFNGGLSASAFLGALGSVRVVSVDIGHWPCVPCAAELIDQVFPTRHALHIGDSTHVVPALPRDAPDDLFDVAFIDGGHVDPVPRKDLENVLPLLRDGGWIIMDDYCVTHGSHGVIAAWDAMVKSGRIRQVGVHECGERGWAVGYKA